MKKIPGFTAELSLSKTIGHYALVMKGAGYDCKNSILPQLRKDPLRTIKVGGVSVSHDMLIDQIIGDPRSCRCGPRRPESTCPDGELACEPVGGGPLRIGGCCRIQTPECSGCMYGCYCGPGCGAGPEGVPVDDLDECCKVHDLCYGAQKNEPVPNYCGCDLELLRCACPKSLEFWDPGKALGAAAVCAVFHTVKQFTCAGLAT